jgi:hypothetical protein
MDRGRVLVAVVLACAWLCGCTGGGGGPVAITVSPGTALFDQPVKVSIRGLPARAVTTVTATARDAAGVTARELRVPADGVYGRWFRPDDSSTRRPGLLVFGGSEGGLHPTVVGKAALLAAHGYPTLALAY